MVSFTTRSSRRGYHPAPLSQSGMATRIGYNPSTSFNRGVIAQTGFLPEGTQLLQDVWPLEVIDVKKKAISESAGQFGNKPVMRVTGLFQNGDTQNANGRVYATPILSEAVYAIQEDVKNRSVWGEFDHPPDAKIHLDRISHLLTKIWMEGNKVFGEAEIVRDLPYGQQLATLLEHGSIGISSRGIGDMEVREEGGQEIFYVTEGYRFVTWDAVAEPSVSGAILNIQEGKLRPLQQYHQPKSKHVVNDNAKHIAESVMVKEIGKFLAS